jgi:hypothetical protein
MKLLKIDAAYHNYLIVKHALRLDASGNEMLIGLTAAESADYTAVMSAMSVTAVLGNDVDHERFLMLYARHIAALPRDDSAFDARRPATW